MSTQLTSQLNGLQIERVDREGDGIRKRFPSVLFGTSAGQFTMEQIHEISSVAFNELIIMNSSLKKYSQIFSTESISYDREIHTPKDNELLDKQIDQFLQKLVGFFTYPAALKSIEFLIRRFRIDIHHSKQLITYFLPYHELQSYKLLLQCVKQQDFDEKAFPCSRSQLQNYFLKLNSINLGNQIVICKQMKQQSYVIHVKFICVIILEIYGKIQNSQNLNEFVRKSLDFAFDELKNDNNEDVLSWLLSVIVLLSKESIQEKFFNKLIYRILELTNIENQVIVKALCKVSSNQDQVISYEVAEKIVDTIEQPIKELDPVLSKVVTALLNHKLDKKQISLSVIKLSNLFNTFMKKDFILPQFNISLTRQILFFAENNTEIKKLLQVIEEKDQHSFNLGFTEFAQSGGDLQNVTQFIKNEALIILQEKILNSNSTLSQAILNSDSGVRYSAFVQLEQIIQQTSQSTNDSLLQFILERLSAETEFNIIIKLLQISQQLLSQQNKEILSKDISVDYILQSFRRIIRTPSPFTIDACQELKNLIQEINNATYKQITIIIDLLNLFTVTNGKLDETYNFIEQNIQFSYFPFESLTDYQASIISQYHANNVLLAIYLVNIEGREQLLNESLMDQINQSPQLKNIFMNKLHKLENVNKLVSQLKNDVLYNFLLNKFTDKGLESVLQLIQETYNATQNQTYTKFLQYLLTNLTESDELALTFFLDLFGTKNQVQSVLTLLQQSNFTLIKALATSNIQQINQIFPSVLPKLTTQPPLFIKSFLSFIFNIIHQNNDTEISATLLIDLFTLLIDQQTPDFVLTSIPFFTKILTNSMFSDIGLFEIAYHNMCLLDDQIQQNAYTLNPATFSLLLTVLCSVNTNEFLQIPFVLFAVFDVSQFEEIGQQVKNLAENVEIVQKTRKFFEKIPISLSKNQVLQQTNSALLIEILYENESIIEDIGEILDFIVLSISESTSEVFSNTCVNLLLKYQETEQIELSEEQAGIVFSSIQSNFDIAKLLNLFVFLDAENALKFVKFAVKSEGFTGMFLREFLGQVSYRFKFDEFIGIVKLLVVEIIEMGQLDLLLEIQVIVPETLAVVILIISQSEKKNYTILKQLAKKIDQDSVFGSVSVLLGYLFDIPQVMEILTEENDTYLPKSFLDAVITDNEVQIENSIFYVEILLQNIDQEISIENTLSSHFSSSFNQSPIEFLLQIVLMIPDSLDFILEKLSTLFTSVTVVSKLVNQTIQTQSSELILIKSFKVLSLSIQNITEFEIIYEVFMDMQELIEQHKSELFVLEFMIIILEKTTPNTKSIEVAEFFTQSYLEYIQNETNSTFLDQLLYGMSFIPILLKMKLVKYDSIIDKISVLNIEFKPQVLSLVEQIINYSIRFLTFKLDKILTILTNFSPATIGQNFIFGEIEYQPEEQQDDLYKSEIAYLEQIQTIIQLIQSQLPYRLVFPLLEKFIISNNTSNKVQVNYVLYHTLKCYSSLQIPVSVLVKFFINLMKNNIQEYNNCAVTVLPLFIQQFNQAEFDLFLSEMLNFGGMESQNENEKIFPSTNPSLTTPNIQNLIPFLQILAGISTTKSTQFYNFITAKLVDLMNQIENSTIDKSAQFQTQQTDLNTSQTPFYVFNSVFGSDTQNSHQLNLSYALLRFSAEFFHSAPYVLEGFLVLKITETISNLHLENEFLAKIEQETFVKLVKLQINQVNFEQTLVEITRFLMAKKMLGSVLEVVRGSEMLFVKAAEEFADEFQELLESVQYEGIVREIIEAIEAGCKKSFRSFLRVK